MGGNIRQPLPLTATTQSAADVGPRDPLFPTVEAVLAFGGVLRDLTFRTPSVSALKLNASNGRREFMPHGEVSRWIWRNRWSRHWGLLL